MVRIKIICVFAFLMLGIGLLLTNNRFVPEALSYSTGPPPGHTGGPGEGICSECHFANPGPGIITINAPANYVPGQTYQIHVQHTTTDMTRLRWGFELTALDGTDSAAGTFADTSPFTQTDFGAGRFYIEHTETGTFPGTTGGAQWAFDWTAPATDVGPVTFYAAGNQANNDNTFDGDQIYTTSAVTASGGSPTATNTATNTPTATNTSTATATATPTATGTGDNPGISGTITYGNAIGNPAPPRFVKNVTVESTAGTPPVGPVITGTPGAYTLTGFGSGSYTIKPSKPSGPSSAITSNDAARIAQGVSGAVPFVSQNQRFVADTSGNGAVSSNDAALVARFAAGLNNFQRTGSWFFFTTGAPSPLPTPPQAYDDSRTYAGPVGTLTGQDYVGLLVGEVSGNWNPAIHPRGVNGPERNVSIELPNLAVENGKEILIPIKIGGISNQEVVSYEFDLRYDPSVIQPQAEPVDVKGTLSRGLMTVTNPNEPGLLRVVAYGIYPIDANGVLLNLRFMAIGNRGTESPLCFERVTFNEGESQTTITDGQIGISGSSANE